MFSKSFSVSTQLENVDDVFESVGGFGKFQIYVLVLLLSLEVPAAFVCFSPVFTGATPLEWDCDGRTITKLDPDFCIYNCTLLTSQRSTIVSEWNLICDFSWVSDFLTTGQMLGMLFGNALTGHCADWYGRRKTLLGNVLWLAGGTTISALAPNVYIYGLARFICGLGFSGFIFLSMTYAMEFMTPDWRSICSSVGPFGEGIMLLGLLGYYFQDSWRNLLLVSAIPYCLILVIFPLLPESPRWLLRQGRIKEAEEIFAKIARFNGTSPIDLETLQNVSEKEGSSQSTEKITYSQFFKNKEIRFTALCLMGIWMSWAIMYFGISYNIKNLGGNPFLNVVFMGLCDSIGYPCSYFVNSCLTRRRSLAFFMTLSSIFLTILAALQLGYNIIFDRPDIVLILCLLGKLCAAGGRASARLMTGESFPTSVRNMGFGLVGVAASMTAIFAPQLAYLGSYWPALPLFIFALSSLFGAGVTFLLKETKGEPMEEGMKKKRFSIASIANSVRRLSRSGGALSVHK